MSLLHSTLMLLFESLHLLLLFVAPMNGLSDGSTNGTSHILTPMVVTENISATHTVLHRTLLVLAVSDMLPKLLHASTVRGNRTLSCIILASRCVT